MHISSIIFICDTSSCTSEVFCSRARMWNCLSITPRRKSHLNVRFHKGSLHKWYYRIAGIVQVIAHGPLGPHVWAMVCSERQVKWIHIWSFSAGQAHMLGRWQVSLQSTAWQSENMSRGDRRAQDEPLEEIFFSE